MHENSKIGRGFEKKGKIFFINKALLTWQYFLKNVNISISCTWVALNNINSEGGFINTKNFRKYKLQNGANRARKWFLLGQSNKKYYLGQIYKPE